MGKWIGLLALILVVAMGTQQPSAASNELGLDSTHSTVSISALENGSLVAQTTYQSSQESSGSSTRVRSRGFGKLIKFAAIGVIAIGGWFLKWTLGSD